MSIGDSPNPVYPPIVPVALIVLSGEVSVSFLVFLSYFIVFFAFSFPLLSSSFVSPFLMANLDIRP